LNEKKENKKEREEKSRSAPRLILAKIDVDQD
jgi:hypothetical protein